MNYIKRDTYFIPSRLLSQIRYTVKKDCSAFNFKSKKAREMNLIILFPLFKNYFTESLEDVIDFSYFDKIKAN